MNDEVMIDKIKVRDGNGSGRSIRALAESSSISRHTIHQYRCQDDMAIRAAPAYPERTKGLDGYPLKGDLITLTPNETVAGWINSSIPGACFG